MIRRCVIIPRSRPLRAHPSWQAPVPLSLARRFGNRRSLKRLVKIDRSGVSKRYSYDGMRIWKSAIQQT